MAVDDVESFQLAEHILVYLSHTGHIGDKVETHVALHLIVTRDITLQVVILVANKADQVRSREIKSTAGKQMAVKYGVKYIETSPGEAYR